MVQLTPAERLIRIGSVIGEAITPFIASNAPEPDDLDSWLRVFDAEDQTDGGSRHREMDDVRILLKVLSRYWRHFRNTTTPVQTAWARELLIALNTAAHVPAKISALDAGYSAGMACRLIDSFGSPAEYRARIEAIATDGQTGGDEADTGSVSAAFDAGVNAAGPLNGTSDDAATEPNDDGDGSAGQSIGSEPASAEAAEKVEQQQWMIDARLQGEGHGLESVTQRVGDAIVTVVYRPAINFALVHNGVGPLAGIGVINTNQQKALAVTTLRASLSSLVEPDAGESGVSSTVGRDWTGPVRDVAAGDYEVVEGSALAWPLPSERFIDIDESTADELILDLEIDGQAERISIPVRLLAHDEWNSRTVPELLAAFVRPRSEAVVRILSTAADILQTRTGDPSLVGYQSGTDRARATAEAIYDAISELMIRYSEPPASFEDVGQKLRSHETVVDTRFGTCIDLSLLYAAALEEAGLNPTLVLFPGHAYAGVFLSDVSTSSFVVDSKDQLNNLFGGHLMVPVEMTGATAGTRLSFDDAVARAYDRAAHGRVVTYVLDVRSAHRRVRPLPKVIEDNGTRVLEKLVHVTAPRTRTGEVARDDRALAARSFPPRVQRWRSDLLDLSLRNPLLKLSESRGIHLLVPPHTLGEFEDRLNNNQSVRLVPHDELADIHLGRGLTSARHLPEHELESVFLEEGAVYAYSQRFSVTRRLTTLRRDARSIKEETGANSLFLTLGTLRWKDRAGTKEGRAPLYLLPVRLTGSSSRPYEVSLEPGAVVQPNYCLIEKLRQEHDLTLDVLETPYQDDSGIDIDRILSELRDRFVSSGFDFSVDESVQLAILQFSTIDLWRDLSENWRELGKARVVDHLIDHPGEEFDDVVPALESQPADEADAYLPVAADGSQLQAIRAATAGRTFVLEGPPGTGKSQTITNMIADGLSTGRTILFVAEKQAALTVVHDRLRRIGLNPLVLNVHGQSQTLNTVRQQLRDSIGAERRNTNASAFRTLRQKFRERVEDLSRYPMELHKDGDTPSVWSQYQRCLQLELEQPLVEGWVAEEIDLPAAAVDVDPSVLAGLIREITTLSRRAGGKALSPAWTMIGDARSSAAGSTSASSDGSTDAAERAGQIVDASIHLADALAAMPQELRILWEEVADRREQLWSWLAGLPTQTSLLPSQLDQPSLDPALVAAVRDEVSAFRQRWSGLLGALTPAAHHANVPRLREQYKESQAAGFLKRRRLEKIAHDEIRVLAVPEIAEELLRDPMRFLGDLEALRLEEDAMLSRVRSVAGPTSLPVADPQAEAELRQIESDARDRQRRRDIVRGLVADRSSVAALMERIVMDDTARAVSGRLLEALDRFEAAWAELGSATGATTSTVDRWKRGRGLVESIEEDAATWRTYDVRDRSSSDGALVPLQLALEQLRSLGFGDVADQIGQGRSARNLGSAVELALARAHLARAITRSGLDVFDDEAYAETVSSYLESSRQLKMRMTDELAARLFDSPARRAAITPGLRKEVDRQRGGAIRSLFDHYGRDILAVTPCVLMSPAAVARYLPPESVHFDTVIFDEASQIRVADAVGALGRADSAVIAGDSKQMPPTSMFSSGPGGADEENDDGVLGVADQESILSEAVGSGFEQKWLSWHYRSRDESLIAFSNIKYYGGKLAVLPSPPEERPGFGIDAVFVGGQFDRGNTRTNRAEADAIVSAIGQRLADDPRVSLGVVTFNTEQRDLVLDLLEASTEPAIQTALAREEEPLVVKNLENVQGDERDVIYFSLAFSKDPETGKLPLNFGPLNRTGGERRLNVAITRARVAVTLFSSFTSSDIDLQRTSAEGLAHLKEYLAHAERGVAVSTANQLDDYNLYRDRLAQVLTDAGLEVVPDVGTSKVRVDLGVRASADHGWLAVTLDSPEWAERAIVADRVALPATILEAVMGWQGSMQVLLPVWISNPERVIKQVIDAARALEPLVSDDEIEVFDPIAAEAEELTEMSDERELMLTPVAAEWSDSMPVDGLKAGDQVVADPLAPILVRSAAVEAAVQPEATGMTGDDSADRSGAYEYVEADAATIGDRETLDRMDERTVRAEIRAHLEQIIDVEGPIEAGRLAKVLATRYGLGTVRKSRVEAILACAPRRPESVASFGRFYWPQTIDPDTYTGYRPRIFAGAVGVDEISHREIANALIAIIEEQGEQSADDLIREAAGVFGYDRLGPRIRERFEAVISWALRTKRLVRSEDGRLGTSA